MAYGALAGNETMAILDTRCEYAPQSPLLIKTEIPSAASVRNPRFTAALTALANGQLLIANCLLHFLMPCMLAAALAILLELQTACGRLLVLRRRVITLFAVAAL